MTKSFLERVDVQYVLDSIDPESYGAICIGFKDKVEYFFDVFEKEYNYAYNQQRYPKLQDRIANYLQGLPSCIHIPFTYYDIDQVGRRWGVNEPNLSLFRNEWFTTIAKILIKLGVYYHVLEGIRFDSVRLIF